MIRRLEADAAAPTATIVKPSGIAAPTAPRLDRRFVTAALMLVMVLASMEMTITATAMPTIIGALHGLEHYAWVPSIYLLAGTVAMPLYGRLADALGRKRVILFAIVLFCAASMGASFARSMTQLIVWRGLQGLGAGGIMPVVLTILGDIFTLQERARIQAFFSGVWGTSALAGPALGALLVKTLGWRSIFWVNVPLGIVALVVLTWKYHDHEKPHSTELDLPGVASVSIAAGALLVLVSRLGPDGWSLPVALDLTLLVIASIAFFIWNERRTGNPILPPSLFMRRAIGPSLVASFIFGMGFLALETYVPLYVQGGRGGGVAAAAGVITPVMLLWAVSGIAAAPLLVRWGFRRTATTGAALIVLGFAGLLACAITRAPNWAMTAFLATSGIGFAFASMSYLLSAQHAVGWQQRGVVTAAVGFSRSMGGAMGVGALGALFNVIIARDLDRFRALGLKPAELLDPRSARHVDPATLAQVRQSISGGLLWVFVAMVLLSVALLAVTTLLPPRKADHVEPGIEPLPA